MSRLKYKLKCRQMPSNTQYIVPGIVIQGGYMDEANISLNDVCDIKIEFNKITITKSKNNGNSKIN